jgi:uncharacterized cupin superfamily protein
LRVTFSLHPAPVDRCRIAILLAAAVPRATVGLVKKLNIADVPEEEQRSPSGKFHSYCRNLSLALGGSRNAGLSHGGHPFDVQIRRVPPGAAICPFHSHLGQWELFVIQSGEGRVRAGGLTLPVTTGELFIHPPGEPHQLINSGQTDLIVLIIADNPPVDACYYPDSDKWSLRPPGKLFRMHPADYFEGEDESTVPVPEKTYRPNEAPPSADLAPFAQRKLHPDAVPWETWTSPRLKYRGTSKELSIALGGLRNTPSGLGGHPFDLELSKLAPGAVGVPYHSHVNQWEMFLVLSGQGAVRTPAGVVPIKPGDVLLQQPGDHHQIRNPGNEELVFFLIADNPATDIWHYPDSNKWGFKAPRKIFRLSEIDYWDGEE